MKKLILIALAFAGLNASAGSIGIKPVVNQPSCFNGTNGSVSLVVSGGLSPYTYLWSNGSTAATQTGLAAGTYGVTVRDANNQTSSYSVIVTQPSKINVSTSATNVSQSGGSNGCVHTSVYGGTPDYHFHWSNNVNTQDQCGLPAGTYTVTVTDGFGCTSTASKTITQPVMYGHINHPFGQETSANPFNNGLEPSNGSNGNQRSDITDNNNAPEGKNLNVSVYPNPASNSLNVRLESAGAELTLINALGQTMIHQFTDATETKIDVSNLAKGNYILITKTETESVNKIITVIK